MAANYVKFRRGTPEAWKALQIKDSDTLYFIAEADENVGSLYLGEKLIAGSAEGDSGASALKDLSDVLISEGLADTDILVYDTDATAWLNKPLTEVLPLFVGATADSSGVAGLVPVPAAGQTNLFLRSDGKWAEITASGTTASENNIYSAVNTLGLDHIEFIAAETASTALNKDDIFIVKDLIYDDKYQHTAYVYNGSNWVAMDGNYNAENIYFDEDLLTTSAVGVIQLENGQATIPAAGKNLKEVWQNIFVQEKTPKITNPIVSVTLSSSKTSYEVGTEYAPGYTASLKAGSYEYGPSPTGVTASAWSITDTNGNNNTNSAGAFDSFTIGDDTKYKITAEVTYTDGLVPVTNTGNDYAAGQLKGATISASTSTVTGFRNSFYGTMDTKVEILTSDNIRSLTPSNKALIKGSTVAINIPVGALRVILAFPAAIGDVAKITDRNGLGAEITSSFKSSTLEVEGLNGYATAEYKLYTLDFAEPYDTANIFDVTI